jgi:hypothetical protein
MRTAMPAEMMARGRPCAVGDCRGVVYGDERYCERCEEEIAALAAMDVQAPLPARLRNALVRYRRFWIMAALLVLLWLGIFCTRDFWASLIDGLLP